MRRVLLCLLLACNAPPPQGVTLAANSRSDATAATPTPSATSVEVPTAFFPPGTFPTAIDKFVADWYGKHLTAMKEPSLWASAARGHSEIRFLWLRTWGRPIAVRVHFDGVRAHLTATRLTGDGGYDPGKVDVQRERDIPIANWQKLEAALTTASFDTIETEGPMGQDGAQWVIERAKAGKYRLVERWSPKLNPTNAAFASACEAFLDLAGRDLVTGDVY